MRLQVKVFLAWSGPASEQLAELMHEWLPSVVQAIEPFMSSQDIPKGQRWPNEVHASLAEAQFALLCLTPLNLTSSWILFEAGAAWLKDQGRVSALLLDVSPTQIESPLQQFQHTRLTKSDLWRLVQDLNRLCATPLSETRLRKSFERHYADVEPALEEIRKTLAQEQRGRAEPARSTELTVQQGLASKVDTLHAQMRKRRPLRSRVLLASGKPARDRPVPMPTRSDLLNRQFGEQLRQQRIAQGWSQSALSLKAGAHWAYISQLERGFRSPNIAVLCRLSRALQVAPSVLLARVERRVG